jgi:uncharacterized protein involved in type VI secretion and phage assembly
MKKFYGKYRGMVINNVDPKQEGRLLVQVPDVLGPAISSWAMPCVPLAGPQSGTFVLPMLNAGVWIEFEGGDPDYPIWTGCFWGSAAEVPALGLAGTPASPNIVLQTVGQNSLVISDVPAMGLMLKSTTGATLTINQAGIIMQDGKGASVALTGGAVAINGTAMVIK